VIPSYPHCHPLHCSLCAERWKDPELREKARRYIVSQSIERVSKEHYELFAGLADGDERAERGKAT